MAVTAGVKHVLIHECQESTETGQLPPQVICRIDLYGIKARLRRAGGLRAALPGRPRPPYAVPPRPIVGMGGLGVALGGLGGAFGATVPGELRARENDRGPGPTRVLQRLLDSVFLVPGFSPDRAANSTCPLSNV
jgi:hypothetical protein